MARTEVIQAFGRLTPNAPEHCAGHETCLPRSCAPLADLSTAGGRGGACGRPDHEQAGRRAASFPTAAIILPPLSGPFLQSCVGRGRPSWAALCTLGALWPSGRNQQFEIRMRLPPNTLTGLSSSSACHSCHQSVKIIQGAFVYNFIQIEPCCHRQKPRPLLKSEPCLMVNNLTQKKQLETINTHHTTSAAASNSKQQASEASPIYIQLIRARSVTCSASSLNQWYRFGRAPSTAARKARIASKTGCAVPRHCPPCSTM